MNKIIYTHYIKMNKYTPLSLAFYLFTKLFFFTTGFLCVTLAI